MNATAAPAAPAAVLAAAIERARPLAVAAAKARVTRFHQTQGRYPVTVGGYVVGYVERFALATSKTAVWWAADDADGNRVAAGLERRADAVEVLGATDAAVEAYRTAAREGAFGYPVQRAIEADDAELAAALEAEDDAQTAAVNQAPLINCGTCEALAGFTCDPGCTGTAERVTAERDDRNEHDALRGVKWVDGCPLPGEMCDPDVDHDHDPIPDAIITDQEAATVTAPAEHRTIPYIPGRTGWAVGNVGRDKRWLTVIGAAYDPRLLFADRAGAQARAEVLTRAGWETEIRHVRVVDHVGVTLTGVAYEIIPEPGAAYRAALAADAPTGDPCPACHQLHDTAGAEAECIAQADR